MRSLGGMVRPAILGIAVLACSTQPSTDPPTIGEAQAFLGEIVVLARRGDFDALCAMAGDGNCEQKLE